MAAYQKARVGRLGVIGAAVALVGAAAVGIIAAQPASAYDGDPSWAVAATQATVTSSAGLVTTVAASGDVTLNTHESFTATGNNARSAEFTPNIAMSTDALRWTVGTACFAAGTCEPTGSTQVGALVITFSEPVKNPTLHLEGIGGSAGGTSFGSTYRLDSAASDGATLGAVSSGATNLHVTAGNTLGTAGSTPGTDCATPSAIGPVVPETAGCGSVQVIGTVTRLTFAVGIASQLVTGTGADPIQNAGDAVGLAVTVDQDYSDAPTSYDTEPDGTADAPRHDIGTLALGTAVDADNVSTLDSVTSPLASTGIAVNSAGDDAKGSDEDAVPSWPALTTAMIGASYRTSIPISGTARGGGQVCGYLDFAHHANFAAAEDKACADFQGGATSVALAWPVPADTTAGLTYARLRIAYGSDPTAAAGPLGPAASGEVEDYALSIRPTITIAESLPAGTAGTLDLSVDTTVLAHGATSGASTGPRTVGPAGGGLTAPDVALGPYNPATDLSRAPLAVTVAEAPTAGNSFSYAAALSCVDGLGHSVTNAASMVANVTIPQSGSANGPAQNITCTYTTTGVAALHLTATADPVAVTTIGQPVTYTFVGTNTGAIAVSAAGIAAERVGATTTDALISCAAVTLDPGSSTTCTVRYTATAADFDAGAIRVAATLSGRSQDASVASQASATVTTTRAAQLSLRETADPTSITAPGPVGYSFAVTNSGNVTVTDLVVGDPSTSTVVCPTTTLAAGATTTCSANHRVTAADIDAGSVTDTATATGIDVTGAAVSSTASSVTVTVTQQPALTVAQSADPSTAANVGELLTFSFTVSNPGNVTISAVAVTDTITTSDNPSPVVNCPAATLAAGTRMICTATYTVTADDLANTMIESRAAVTGTAPGARAVTAASTVVVAAPAALAWSADGIGVGVGFASGSVFGPALGAGGGALIAGIGLLVLAAPRQRGRRGRRAA